MKNKYVKRSRISEAKIRGVVRYFAEIKASLLLLKWMVGFTLAFVVAMTWWVFA